MTLNLTPEAVAYLQETLDWITANPERWDQGDFATRTDCGTTHCVAGWLVARSPLGLLTRTILGDEIKHPDGQVLDWDGGAALALGLPLQYGCHCDGGGDMACGGGYYVDAATHDALWTLFEGSLSLSQVWRAAQALAGGRLTTPPDPRDSECLA